MKAFHLAIKCVSSVCHGRLLLFLGCMMCLLLVMVIQAQSPSMLWSETNYTGVIAYSPTQPLIAAAEGFGDISIFSPDGMLVERFQNNQGAITALAFSPDGQTLAAGANFGMNGCIQLWRMSDGACLQTLNPGYVSSLAFAPDGQYVASGSLGITQIWRVSDGACLQYLPVEISPIVTLAFAPDGNSLAVGGDDSSADGFAQIWGLSTGTCLFSLIKQKYNLTSLAFTPDGQTLVCGGWNSAGGSVQFWSVSADTCQQTITTPDFVNTIALTPDGQTLAIGSTNNSISIWRVSDGSCLMRLNGQIFDVNSLAFSGDGQTLAAGMLGGNGNSGVELWRLSDATNLLTLTSNTAWVNSVAYAPDGKTLASCAANNSGHGVIQLRRYNDGVCLRTIVCQSIAKYVAFSPDSLTIASGCQDNNGNCTLPIWRVSDGACLQTLTGANGQIHSLAFSPDGQLLASGGEAGNDENGFIQLWNVSDGTCLQTLNFLNSVSNVAFSPDGQILAIDEVSATGSSSISLWNISDGSFTQIISGLNYVDSVAFTPDGQILASAGMDSNYNGIIELWRVSDGSCVQILNGMGQLNTVTFSPDGQTLASGTYNYGDGIIQLWQVTDGIWQQSWDFPSGFSIYSEAFSPDGHTLASGGLDGLALWNLSSPLSSVTLTPSPASPQPLEIPITLTAAATGGASVQYQFWAYNPDLTPAWQLLQAYSNLDTCSWIPTTAGNYLLSVTAQDGFTGMEVNAMLWYGITGVPLSAVNVTASLSSPQPVDTPITLTAMATGGTDVLYQFWLYNPAVTPAWSQLQAYSSLNTCTWTPTYAGSYLLSVTARDGVTGNEVNQTLWYTVIVSTMNDLTVATTSASPQPVDTAITLVAGVSGGINVSYQFWAYNPLASPTWNQLQAFSTQASCVWTPASSGNYLLSVTAHDGATGYELNKLIWFSIIPVVSLSASPVSPQPTNTLITLTATATGGTDVQYSFWCYNPAATPAWSQLQASSTADTCAWTPVSPGNYLLSVTALDGASGATVSASCWFTVTGVPLTGLAVAATPNSPQPANTPITLVAAATGGTNVQYQFWVYNPEATPEWSQLQAFSTTTMCPWTPAAAGNYLLSVTAQDGVTGAQVNQTFWYTITPAPLTAVTVSVSPASPQPANTPINITAMATGGTSVQYQFWEYNPLATPAWSQLQAYSSMNTFTWTPAAVGSYLLSVTAQDGAAGNEVNTTLWYTINYATATILSGTVTTPKGVAVPSSVLTFFLNGTSTAVGSQSTASAFSFGVSPGTYTIESQDAENPTFPEATFLGPYYVGSSIQTLNIISPMAFSDFPFTVTSPTDGTSTIIVMAVNSGGLEIPGESFTASVGSQTANSVSYTTGSYAVLTEVPASSTYSTSMTVTPSGGTALYIYNISPFAGYVVLVDAVL